MLRLRHVPVVKVLIPFIVGSFAGYNYDIKAEPISFFLLASLVLVIMLLLLAAVGFAAEPVEIRAKAGVDFSEYESYAWASHDHLVEGNPLRDGEPLDLEIKSEADKLIGRNGFERVERDASPDLLINYVGYGTDMTDIEGITKQVAPGVKWIGDPQAHSMRSYREGTLVFEVVDTATEEMVWSGWVTELARTFEKLRAKASKATRRVFTHFPQN